MGRVATNALLLVLAGCNQFFDLDTTQLTDASHPFFDAAPDAPPMCADPSMTPRFDRELHQAVYIDEKCESYQTSAVGLALAACDLSKLNPAIREAPVGPWKEMTLAKGNIQQANVVYNLALAPEGNEVFLARYDAVLGAGIWRYARDANGAWNLQEKLPVTFTAAQRISTVTRGPKRHMFVIETNQQLHEWATDDNGTWSSVRTSTATNLGV
ncbi:MAG TPA: hypothetical protein VMZ53_12745, partial [Kofleriaceae bacterium]|nr:hypothetical protein [Kofleriaceae bacterium]